MSYQGWTNEQTWCVALTINNDKDLQAQVLRHLHFLKSICKDYQGAIVAMADWAWPNGYQADEVNFNELLGHFEEKKREAI